MHRYEAEPGSWILTLGLVVENTQKTAALLDPKSFLVLDSLGILNPAWSGYKLKNPLGSQVDAGGVAVGSLAFKLKYGAEPVLLQEEGSKIRVMLNKEVRPPGTAHPPGTPVACKKSTVGIEGIYRSEEGRMLRVEFLLKNTGAGALPLEDRAYGRFGVLIDSIGMSYSAFDYKMLGPAIPPGASVEGYMIYAIPAGAKPRYLLFWPPDEDAVLFELGL